MSDWDHFRFFPKSRPRIARGGIKAQSQRGRFGESWWAKRWIAALESLDLGARLQRGRSYARRGQVLTISVGNGRVDARVQGSRPKPYEVAIEVKPLSKRDWKKVAETVASQAIFGAKLLAGQMPEQIGDAFRSAGLSLFPEKQNDLTTDCSCPDWSNPCKHIAAVYYLLGEEFDRDPFLIFKLRGMTREDFLELLGDVSPPDRNEAEGIEPLPSSPPAFWAGGPIPEDLIGVSGETDSGAALPRRLGRFPFWRGAGDLHAKLDLIYHHAARQVARALSLE